MINNGSSRKIVHLIGQLGRGGSERQLFRLTQALKNKGWVQSVIAFAEGGIWQPRLEQIGIPVYVVPKSCSKIGRVLRLRKLLIQENPALLHNWSPHTAIYARWATPLKKIKMLYGIRIDLTIDAHTGCDNQKIPYLNGLLAADYVVSNSQDALKRLQSRGFTFKNAVTISNIIDIPQNVQARNSNQTTHIVTVGQLIPRKGYETFIEALKVVAHSGADFSVSMAGNGESRQHLEFLSKGLEKNITFLGDVEDISSLLHSADLFVHPSYREGLSNAVLEAMAAGLPVIASNSGSGELIEDKKSGLLFHAGDSDALADAILSLIRNAEQRKTLGEEARNFVQNNCNEAFITECYENIYHEIL